MQWWAAAMYQQSPVLLYAWVFWVIVSITLHELGHGWSAIRHGDDTPIHTGHMTPNPLVHMGGFSLVVFALIGIAWGAMPVDPSRLKGRHADAIVAAAGPAMNIGLAATCLLLAALVDAYLPRLAGAEIAGKFYLFFAAGSMLNIALVLFNLVPIPPLDGSRILASFSPAYVRFAASDVGRGVMFISLGVMFFGAGRWLFRGAAAAFTAGFGAVSGWLP